MVLPGRGLSWKEFLKTLWKEYSTDNISDVAGAVTYSAIMALFPFLLFLVALASVIIDPSMAEKLVAQLGRVAPAQVTEILGERIRQLGAENNVGLLTFGALFAVISASGGMRALMRALNTVYDVEESRPTWKVWLISIVMTLVTAAVAIFAVVVVVALPPIAARFDGTIELLVTLLRIPFAALVMMLVWAILYYALPDVEQRFKFITPGSVSGVLLWALASWGFSLYVQKAGHYDAQYGALGGAIVMLLWMWISAQVILIGAEVNAILEHKSPEGKVAGAKSMADTGVSDSKTEEEEKAQQELERLAAKGKRAEELERLPKRGWLTTIAAAVAFRALKKSA